MRVLLLLVRACLSKSKDLIHSLFHFSKHSFIALVSYVRAILFVSLPLLFYSARYAGTSASCKEEGKKRSESHLNLPLIHLHFSASSFLFCFCVSRPILSLPFIHHYHHSFSLSLSTGVVRFELTTSPVELWVADDSVALDEKLTSDEIFGPFYRIEQLIITRDRDDPDDHDHHDRKGILYADVLLKVR